MNCHKNYLVALKSMVNCEVVMVDSMIPVLSAIVLTKFGAVSKLFLCGEKLRMSFLSDLLYYFFFMVW